jgi:hypothetical protein
MIAAITFIRMTRAIELWPRQMFAEILSLIARLRAPSALA